MITLLSKIFIKNNKDYENVEVRRAYGMLCSIVGIVLNVILFVVKFVIGILAGAVSVMADSYNNLSDAGSSLLSLFGFKFSGKKATDDRPFGHGRIEYVAGLAIAGLIIVAGVMTLRDSVSGLINGATPDVDAYSSVIPLVVLGCTVLVKLYMVFYNTTIGKKINSAPMKAVGSDSLLDVVSTSLVLACALIYKFTGVNLDGYCGALVSVFIVFVGINSARDTIGDLLGKKPSKALVEEIYSIVMSYDEIIGVHDLVVHDYGPGRLMISLHAEVSGDLDIYLVHDVIDRAMMELDQKLGCVSVIHQDPVCVNDDAVTEARVACAELMKTYNPGITIHDFRMVIGPTHTNYIFDVVLPHSVKESDAVVKEKLEKLVSETFPDSYAVIKIEKSYI